MGHPTKDYPTLYLTMQEMAAQHELRMAIFFGNSSEQDKATRRIGKLRELAFDRRTGAMSEIEAASEALMSSRPELFRRPLLVDWFSVHYERLSEPERQTARILATAIQDEIEDEAPKATDAFDLSGGEVRRDLQVGELVSAHQSRGRTAPRTPRSGQREAARPCPPFPRLPSPARASRRHWQAGAAPACRG